MATRTTKSEQTGFVVKQTNDNGTVTWFHPETFEEIILNAGTAPTKTLLESLAANGIAPQLPIGSNVSRGTDFDIDDESDDEPESALSRVLTTLRETPGDLRSEVRIYRVRDGVKDVYCGAVSPEDYEKDGLELLRTRWGGGKFRIMVYGPSLKPGSQYGKFCRLANHIEEIEHSIAPVKPGENPVNNQVLEMLMRKLEQLENRPAPAVASGADFMTQFEQFARIQNLMGGNKKEKSIAEQLAELEALKRFKDETLGGGSESEPGLMSMGMKVLEVLKPGLQQQPAPQAVALPAPVLPAGFQQAPQIQPHQPQNESETPVNAFDSFKINLLIGAVLKAAERNDPVEATALFVLDKLPQELIDEIDAPIWFDVLIELAPKHKTALELHKPWLERMHAEMIQILDSEDQTGPES